MSLFRKTKNNEKGFILMTALMLMVVVMIIGIAATNTTTVELKVAGNDKASKMAFYEADGGSRVGIALVEENIEEVGFASSQQGKVKVNTLSLYAPSEVSNWSADSSEWDSPDATLPGSASGTEPHTDIVVGSKKIVLPGYSSGMVSGYEGPGKNMTVARLYTIGSRHYGPAKSEATVVVEWLHLD